MPEVRYWHISDVLRQSSDDRCWGMNRPKSAAPEGRLCVATQISTAPLGWIIIGRRIVVVGSHTTGMVSSR